MSRTSTAPQFAIFPLLWLAASFAAGISIESLVGLNVAATGVVCVTSAIAALVFRGSKNGGAAVLISFAALGALSLQSANAGVGADRLRRLYDEGHIRSGTPAEIEGELAAGPEPAFEGYFLELNSETITIGGQERSASGVIRLFVPVRESEAKDDFRALELGARARIRAACAPEREDSFLNPGVRPRREILDQQDIDATCNVKSVLLIEKLEGGSSVLNPIFQFRSRLIEDFLNRFNGPTAGVLIASLLGDKHYLDRQTAEVFREGGTFHILVISGLHITFIGGLVYWLVGRFTRNRIWLFLLPAGFLWAYTIAVGSEVPVVRASLMFTVLLFSHVVYRKGTLLNSLGLCSLILLAWRPKDLFNPSFLLTIVSVTAIVAIAFPLIEKLRAIGSWTPSARSPFPPDVPDRVRRFCEMLYWRDELWQIESSRQIWSANLFKSPYLKRLDESGLQSLAVFVFEALAVSLIVQIAMLPLSVWYFHRVSLISVFLNLWVGVVIALESFAAIAASAVGQLSGVAAFPLVRITELFNWLLVAVPHLFTESAWASFRVPIYSGPAGAVYVFFFIPVIVLALILNRWEPFEIRNAGKSLGPMATTAVVAATLILAGVVVFHPYSAPRPDGRLAVEFLDVGQGDATFITFPDGRTMLVDGGGQVRFDDDDEFEPDIPRIGEMVVSEFLWEKGYSHIDHLVATHADADHMQGLVDVAENFSVTGAFVGRMAHGDDEFDELSRVLKRRAVPLRLLAAGDMMEIGGVRIETLHPKANSTAEGTDNDSSLVLRLIFGKREILLTGDIEEAAEAELLSTGYDISADVVKVPHHGSRTSSTEHFVSAVNTEHAVIPVGRRSRFGHPHSEVVERWRNAGVEILRTGDRGSISFSTDGENLTVGWFRE